jgi:two-component system, response regulator YesN
MMYRVMFVDDEPSVIESLRRMISKRSDIYTVAGESYDAPKALQLIEELKPDIVFTDIKMPGRSGLELVKVIAQNYSETVVIVISGYDDFSYVHDAFKYGVEDYLLKPLAPKKFLAMLDGLKIKLDNHRAVLRGSLPCPDDEAVKIVHNMVESPSKKVVQEVEEYVKGHIADDPSIVTICREFSISQPYLSRIFKKYRNCTFNDFLILSKIEKAKKLLRERQDLLIGSIATLSGFTDQFYFSKVFKQEIGITPSEYRRHIET